MKQIESIVELRRICQEPYRDQEDIPAVLFGSRLSIYVTQAFLRAGLAPSAASCAMVAASLLGSFFTLLGGWWIVAGLALVSFAYILDCVDGEMARYLGIDSYRWASVDGIHHMLTKGLSFLCLGVGLHLETQTPGTIVAGGVCAVMWLVLLGVRDLPYAMFAKKIVLDDGRARNPAYCELVRDLDAGRAASAQHKQLPWSDDFQLRPWVVRTFFTTFEIVILLLLLAAVADRFARPWWIRGVQFTATSALLYAYALVLPIHALGAIRTALGAQGVPTQLRALASRIAAYRSRDGIG